MTIEQQVAALTTSVDTLKATVVSKKQVLDASVADAQGATSQAVSAKTGALVARDQANAFKDAALAHSASAASAVAYQDLTALAATKAVTAVDVFVYDTSLDSDGGAWRHRCTGTSWYNETLNTATRGARREFPAVAVIVVALGKVTIYDGDDPVLPLWMEEIQNPGGILYSTPGSVAASNGQFELGLPGAGGGRSSINFIADYGFYQNHTGIEYNRKTIAALNYAGPTITGSVPAIVNRAVNDIAMTVLPGAPIDPATGLPIPTIAVATDGGVSVIKDDGTVVDITPSQGASFGTVTQINIDQNNVYFVGPNTRRAHIVKAIPTSDTTFVSQPELATDKLVFNEEQAANLSGAFLNSYRNVNKIAQTGATSFAFNGDCLNLLEGANPATSMVAYASSKYNTGYMPGDIRLAALADTDSTALVEEELVTNGTFDTDTTGWVSFNSGVLAQVGGELEVTTSSTYGGTQQTIFTETGKTYILTFEGRRGTASNISYGLFDLGAGGWVQLTTAINTTNQTFTITHTAVSASIKVSLMSQAGNGTIYFDNVSVKLADADRSVKNKGLVVHGTITRAPVATGAELVAYSGFSVDNYLEQPYNSDLDFGTGDFYVMGWMSGNPGNISDSARVLERTGDPGDGDTGFNMYSSYGNLAFIFYDSGVGRAHGSTGDVGQAQTFFTFFRKGDLVYLYVNGVLDGSRGGFASYDVSVSAPLIVANHNSFAGLKLSLLRIGAGAPTPDQIKRIYEEEKVLFQGNAACTLYGASDAVTALAHDPVTDLLHVGTSAGRSVFKGLRRVSNTTTSVGIAISAVNGLVIEE